MEEYLSKTLTLRSGRKLGYALLGDPDGKPAFFFHGFPGSRLTWRGLDQTAFQLGLRIIATDRPGFGLSDFQPKRQILDWPADVASAADQLGFKQFSVLGFAGGAAYAAACAYKIPQRLKSAVIVSGLAPLVAPGMMECLPNHLRGLFSQVRVVPFLVRFLLENMIKLAQANPDEFVKQAMETFSEADQKLVHEHAWVHKMIIENYTEGFRQGPKGPVHDARLLARSWGFRLEDISAPIFLWQGEEDTETPPAMGHFYAQALPNCKAVFVPEEGHYSVLAACLSRMVQVL